MKIVFISTYLTWGGSEELWTMAARSFWESGHQVFFSTRFDHKNLETLPGKRLPYYRSSGRKGMLSRIIAKVRPDQGTRLFQRRLLQAEPGIIVISQGDNTASWELMNLCNELDLPYVTVTQLVAELHYLFITPKKLAKLRQGYSRARQNFFVSRHNLDLNNMMLGLTLENAEVIFNPCKLHGGDVPEYPPTSEGYRIAMVGRLECFHKGYDLVLQVLAQQKWRDRPLVVTFYGSGPHLDLIRANIERLEIMNVRLGAHVDNVSDIWRQNHALLMASRMEGQSLSLIEAMYCARLPIVTDAGGATELVVDGKSGFVASAATVSAIDEAMERAWQNRESWEQFGKAALTAVTGLHPKDEVLYFRSRIEAISNDPLAI